MWYLVNAYFGNRVVDHAVVEAITLVNAIEVARKINPKWNDAHVVARPADAWSMDGIL